MAGTAERDGEEQPPGQPQQRGKPEARPGTFDLIHEHRFAILPRVQRYRGSWIAGVWRAGLHRLHSEPRRSGAGGTTAPQHAAVRLSRVDAGLLMAGESSTAREPVPRFGKRQLPADELVAVARHGR